MSQDKIYQYTAKVYLSKVLQVIAPDDKEAEARLADIVAAETIDGWVIEEARLNRKAIEIC
jgi:predicted RNA methylase